MCARTQCEPYKDTGGNQHDDNFPPAALVLVVSFRIVAGDYAPGLAMPLALKDVRLALAEAERAAAPMPSVSLVRDRMITAIARGHADLDWTALGLVASEEAGL